MKCKTQSWCFLLSFLVVFPFRFLINWDAKWLAQKTRYNATGNEHFCIVQNKSRQFLNLPAPLSWIKIKPITTSTMLKGIFSPEIRISKIVFIRASEFPAHCPRPSSDAFLSCGDRVSLPTSISFFVVMAFDICHSLRVTLQQNGIPKLCVNT